MSEERKELTRAEAIADLICLLGEVRQGQWCNSEMIPDNGKEAYESHAEIVEALRTSVSKGGLKFYGVTIDAKDEDGLQQWVCHTGNGPTSKKHAEFIAKARQWLPQLLDDLDRLQRLEDQLKSLMADSEGVACLHQSEDVAPWSELVETDWLDALKE